MPQILSVESLHQMPLRQFGRLPNGVRVYKRDYCDELVGTKEALVETGHVQESWFPSEAVAYGKNKYKRRFDPCEHVVLRRGAKGKWQVLLYVSQEEVDRRTAKEAEKAQPSVTAEEFAAAVGKLPAFVPGSMSEDEIYLARIARSLDDRKWNSLVGVAEAFLLQVMEQDGEQKQQQPKDTRLRLVIDNDRPA